MDRLETLERLARLHQQGVLTDEELAAEKAKLLAPDEPSAAPPPSRTPGELLSAAANRIGKKGALIAGAAAAALFGGAWMAGTVTNDIAAFSGPAENSSDAAEKAPAAPDVNLGQVLRFSAASSCTPSEGLQEIVDKMTDYARSGAKPAEIRVAGYEEPRRVRTSATQDPQGAPVEIAEIKTPGLWQGLHVTAVRAASWGKANTSSLQIRFSDPAPEVRAVLKQLGFPSKALGELAPARSANGADVLIGVADAGAGSMLVCVRASTASGRSDGEGRADTPQESEAEPKT